MEQLSFFESSQRLPYTVSQLVGAIRSAVERDPNLRDVRVEGEVSNFHRASSGHCYFTLKDSGAELSCVMWRSAVQVLRVLPKDGHHVLARGRVSVYERRGSVQLYVEHIEPIGTGRLYQEFERLKAALEEEGLFAPERKRTLPRFPQRIGIVTSPDAAALQDMLNVLTRRYPLAEVVLSPTLVQGEEAPLRIVAALAALDARADVDVILLGRGGGSLEDLWAFNDERVARAVADCHIPIICGVGHETDFSLSDFAADCRAPTPSAAAELATPDCAEVREQLTVLRRRLQLLLQGVVDRHRWALRAQLQAIQRLSPVVQFMQARQRVDELAERMTDGVIHDVALRRERLAGLVGRLEGVNPLATLGRGYAIVRRQADGQVVYSTTQVQPGEELQVRVSDGVFGATAGREEDA